MLELVSGGSGNVWYRYALVRSGTLWETSVVGSGRLWYGRLCSVRLWYATVGSGRLLKAVVRCGRIMEDSGRTRL